MQKCLVIQFMVVNDLVMGLWTTNEEEKWFWALIEYITVRRSKEIVIKFNTRRYNDQHPFHLETDYGMMLLVATSAIN